MKVWVVIINGVVHGKCYTSKRAACKAGDVSYQMAMRGKMVFTGKGRIVMLYSCKVVTMSDRVKNLGGSGKKFTSLK